MRPGRGIGMLAIGLIVAAALAGYVTGWVDPLLVDFVLGAFFAFTAHKGAVRLGAPPRVSAAVVSGLLAVALIGVVLWPDAVRLTPYVAFLPANLAVAWLFANGLRPGRTPIILELIRLMGIGPEATPEFSRFVRGQCQVWVALSLLTALAALLCILAPGSAAHILLTGLLVMQAAWFVLSHLYARWVHNRPESWVDTILAMTRPKVWTKLGVGG